jgi:uncharacterized membrane protein
LASLPLLLLDDPLWQGLIRWAHILSGITWIGMLYFFNFVNGPVQGKLDGPTKKIVNPELMPRALWWFRWGAMSTIVFGLLLFTVTYVGDHGMNANFSLDGEMTGRAKWILTGMTLGLIMWFNVWFVIWPAQKILIRATREGQKPPEGLPERAKLFSRINTVLSGPMLIGMVAPKMGWPFDLKSIAIGFVVSLLVIHLCLRASAKVGTTV